MSNATSHQAISSICLIKKPNVVKTVVGIQLRTSGPQVYSSVHKKHKIISDSFALKYLRYLVCPQVS